MTLTITSMYVDRFVYGIIQILEHVTNRLFIMPRDNAVSI